MTTPIPIEACEIAERLKTLGKHSNKEYLAYAQTQFVSVSALEARVKVFQQYLENEIKENTDECAEQAKFDLWKFNELFSSPENAGRQRPNNSIPGAERGIRFELESVKSGQHQDNSTNCVEEKQGEPKHDA